MLKLPRVCHAGLRGPDVHAYSRVYRSAGVRHRKPTTFFGVHMVDNTQHFQKNHGLRQDGVVGPKTFDAMRPYFDGYDRYLLKKEITQLKVPGPRELIVGAALAMYHNRPFPYEEVRPYPNTLAGFYSRGSDCSGTSTGCYHYAHLSHSNVSDPNEMNFNGYGSTYSMVPRGAKVINALPGDLAFYYPTFSHVGVYLGNGNVFSHGKPGDPTIIPLSWATMVRSYL